MNVPIEVYAQIVERVQRDQSVAKNQAKANGYSDEMRLIHEENARFLEETIQTIPLQELLSLPKEVSDGVFIIIQHAISMPTFMRKMHSLLLDLSNPNPIYIAYLEDRIHFFERQPQLYGTQYDYDEQGYMSMYWTIDPITIINQRRSDIGLSRVEENEQRFISQPKLSLNEAEKYMKRQHDWLVKTGWCTAEDIQRYESRDL